MSLSKKRKIPDSGWNDDFQHQIKRAKCFDSPMPTKTIRSPSVFHKEEFGTPAWNAPVRKAISSPWTPIVHKNVSSSEHKSDCDDIDESPITSHTPVVKQVLQSPTHHTPDDDAIFDDSPIISHTPDVKQAIAMQSPIHHTHHDDATFTLYPKPNESTIEEDDNDEYNNENNELEYFTPVVKQVLQSPTHHTPDDDAIFDDSTIVSHTPDVKQAIAMQSPIHHTHDDDATFTLYPKPNESTIEEDDNDEYNNENNELEYFIAYPFNEETNQQFLILNDNKYHYKTNNGRKFYWYCRQEGCRGSLRTIRPHAYTTDATKPFGKIYYVREHTFDHEPTWSLQIAQKQATQHVLCWYICDVFLLFFFLCFHCFLFRRQYRIH
eukprot:163339_1